MGEYWKFPIWNPFQSLFYVSWVIFPTPNKMLFLLKLGHCLQLLTRHCPAHCHTPPSCFLLIIPRFLNWIFKCFDEQSKLLNLRGSCSSNKGWECLLQDSNNHISFQAMNRVSLLSLSFGKMKFLDFLADEFFCHRHSWWFLFLAFLWYPCRSFSRLCLFYNGWCFLNNFCFGYLGIHGQWISKLMFIPSA